MGSTDRWRVVGWGPFALPGEGAAVERARDDTRRMLVEAGLLERDPVVAEGAVLDYDARKKARRLWGVGDSIVLVGDEAEPSDDDVVTYRMRPDPSA